jgi:gamma-glutamylcysteine synthetase
MQSHFLSDAFFDSLRSVRFTDRSTVFLKALLLIKGRNVYCVMKNKDALTQNIYNAFFSPLSIKKESFIGMELEFPIINLNQKPVDICLLQEMMNFLISNYNFEKLAADIDGKIYSVQNKHSKDIICFECSYNTLEFSMHKAQNIISISKRFYNYFNIINNILIPQNHIMTGLGFNPYYKFANPNAIKNNRYEKIYSIMNILKGHREIAWHNNLFSYICSVQTHLDVDIQRLPLFLNVFSRVEWIKAILFSNSLNPDSEIKNKNCLCNRDLVYNNSIFSYNKTNIKGFDVELKNVNDIIDDILDRSIYYTYRNSTFIFFKPTKLKDYFSTENLSGFKFACENKIEKTNFNPSYNDIQHFRSYNPLEITKLGTIEIRSDCQQPLNRTFQPSAFCLGILENLDQIEDYINKCFPSAIKKYSNSQLREMFIYENNIVYALENSEIFNFIKEIIFISHDGLKKRNMGEEVFLEPLIKNMDKLDSPAMHMINLIKQNYAIEEIVHKYADQDANFEFLKFLPLVSGGAAQKQNPAHNANFKF